MARLQAEDASSVDSRASSGFGGTEFWDALRQVGSALSAHLDSFALDQPVLASCIASTGFQACIAQVKGLESEVRYQLTEARIVLRRRNVTPLMVSYPISVPLYCQGLHSRLAQENVGAILKPVLHRWSMTWHGCGS